jgi:hypothetical protein
MWQKILDLLKALSFPDDEEKKHHAHAWTGYFGVSFFFPEKILSSIILGLGILVMLIGMILNREKGQYFISPYHPQILKEYYER